MELIAYLCVIMLYCNLFGSGVLALKFVEEEIRNWFKQRKKEKLRLKIAEVFSNVRRLGKTYESSNRGTD